MFLPPIFGAGAVAGGILLKQLIDYLIGKRKPQRTPDSPIDYHLDSYFPVKQPEFTQEDIERRAFRKKFPRYAPTDLPDYLAYRTKYELTSPVIVIRLKNENPKITRIILEPYGPGDDFPFGANFHIVISLFSYNPPNDLMSFPDQIICTPDWNEQDKLTVIGDFELHDESLFLYLSDSVQEIKIFEENGKLTSQDFRFIR